MGQNYSRKPIPKNDVVRQLHEQPLSKFYHACRDGNTEVVKNLLPSMSIERINRREPNGSTALHAASYYGHIDIVRLLLDAGAYRSLRNLRYNLTPYDEARDEDIRRLLSSIPLSTQTRFIGSSSRTEWSLDTSQAAEWKTHLSNLLEPQLSFREIISYLQENYLADQVNLSSPYTSTTQFYAIVNNHLAQYLLKCFRWDNGNSTIEQCVAHLASIFIHRPELKSLSFTGTVYRGLLLHQSDLEIYTENRRILNKSFLSTSKERSIASIYAGMGDQTQMRIAVDKTPLQYTALCIYIIRNTNTALDIAYLSEIPGENEVLIMPLCAFQVRSVKRNDEDHNDIQIEIELEECDEVIKLDKKNIRKVTRPRVT